MDTQASSQSRSRYARGARSAARVDSAKKDDASPTARNSDVGRQTPQKLGKLDGLAREWGPDVAERIPPTSPTSTRAESVPPIANASDDSRVNRLLQRCACEGLVATREVAERVLQEEGGNVGKALAGMRRVCEHVAQ